MPLDALAPEAVPVDAVPDSVTDVPSRPWNPAAVPMVAAPDSATVVPLAALLPVPVLIAAVPESVTTVPEMAREPVAVLMAPVPDSVTPVPLRSDDGAPCPSRSGRSNLYSTEKMTTMLVEPTAELVV